MFYIQAQRKSEEFFQVGGDSSQFFFRTCVCDIYLYSHKTNNNNNRIVLTWTEHEQHLPPHHYYHREEATRLSPEVARLRETSLRTSTSMDTLRGRLLPDGVPGRIASDMIPEDSPPVGEAFMRDKR